MSDSQNVSFNFAVSTGADASIFAVNQLPDVFGILKEKLQQAATNDGLFAQVFGDKANTAEFQAIRHSWAIGDFSQLPSMQVVSLSTLNGANGAFGTSTQTIYLSDANLTTGSLPQDLIVAKAKVWVEEIGHYLDAKVGQDTAGDEGEHFANSVFGVQLSVAELSRINNEDDHGSIFVNGQKVDVEFSGLSTNPNYVYKQSDYLEALYQDNQKNGMTRTTHEYDIKDKNGTIVKTIITSAFDSTDGDSDRKVYALVGGEVIEAKNGKFVAADQKGNKPESSWIYNGTIAIYNKDLNKTFIYWHFAVGSVDESIKGKLIGIYLSSYIP